MGRLGPHGGGVPDFAGRARAVRRQVPRRARPVRALAPGRHGRVRRDGRIRILLRRRLVVALDALGLAQARRRLPRRRALSLGRHVVQPPRGRRRVRRSGRGDGVLPDVRLRVRGGPRDLAAHAELAAPDRRRPHAQHARRPRHGDRRQLRLHHVLRVPRGRRDRVIDDVRGVHRESPLRRGGESRERGAVLDDPQTRPRGAAALAHRLLQSRLRHRRDARERRRRDGSDRRLLGRPVWRPQGARAPRRRARGRRGVDLRRRPARRGRVDHRRPHARRRHDELQGLRRHARLVRRGPGAPRRPSLHAGHALLQVPPRLHETGRRRVPRDLAVRPVRRRQRLRRPAQRRRLLGRRRVAPRRRRRRVDLRRPRAHRAPRRPATRLQLWRPRLAPAVELLRVQRRRVVAAEC
mmetsp:Transcript_5788/g.24166  ORF Transcript_5788/g.24166 Transcript_5788/m.24166 type:complete len:409 (+) Transcript_5788:2569-3795(+)